MEEAMTDSTVNRHLLESESIAERWSEVSASLSRLMNWMDSKEGWVVGVDSEFLDLLAKVIERVEDPDFASRLQNGENASQVALIFATLHSSRFLRVLEMLDKRSPGIVSRLTLSLGRLGGESEVFAELFYERLMLIHRCELLAQVFSLKRSQAIANCIQVIKGSQ